ncbi:ATP-binding protein [Romboutsia sp. Marseille-P6047]|nr:ATP-binding protein [Romboutsia sp. Marseille-P6047]
MTVSKNTWKLSSIQLTSLYRVIQEALSNCIKHSNATKIQIFLNFNNDNLVINIKDN